MNYQKIIAALTCEPLLITPAAQAALIHLFEMHATLSPEQFRSQREGTGVCGENIELEQAEVVDGIMHIPIGGPVGLRLGSFEKGAGAVDLVDVQKELISAETDDMVSGVLLEFDSPGGMVSGTPETADLIARMEKPVFSFIHEASSAAYWLASASDGIFGTKTASAGSIGIYIPFLDQSVAMAARGLKVDVIKNDGATYKGMGFPGTSLTEEQRGHLVDRANNIAAMFKAHVRSNRGDIAESVMRGQSLMADEAVAAGLMDGIVQDKSAVVRMLKT